MYIKTGLMLAVMSISTVASELKVSEITAGNSSGSYFLSPFFSRIGGEENLINNDDNLAFGLDTGIIYDGSHGYRVHMERLNINENGSSLGGDFMYFLYDDIYLYGGARIASIDKWEIMPSAGAGYDYKIDNNWSIRTEVGGIHSFKNDKTYPNLLLGVMYRFGDRNSYATKQSPDIIPVYRDEPVRMKINVQFEHDSSVIRSIYSEDIEKVANFLLKYKNTEVSFEGHTSSVGSNEYNMNLSKERADAVAKLLVSTHGIDDARVTSIGYGEEKLLVEENNREDEAINRRVTAVLESR